MDYVAKIISLLYKHCPQSPGYTTDITWSTAPISQLGNDKVSHGKPGADLTSVRNLVLHFVMSIDYLLDRLSDQREDRQRILYSLTDVKTELASLSQKRLPHNKNKRDDQCCGTGDERVSNWIISSGTAHIDGSQRSEFKPLVEDLNLSLCKVEERLDDATSRRVRPSSKPVRRPYTMTTSGKPRRPLPGKVANKSSVLK